MPRRINLVPSTGLTVMWGLLSLVVIDKELQGLEEQIIQLGNETRRISSVRYEFNKVARAFSDPWTGTTWKDIPLQVRDHLVNSLTDRIRNNGHVLLSNNPTGAMLNGIPRAWFIFNEFHMATRLSFTTVEQQRTYRDRVDEDIHQHVRRYLSRAVCRHVLEPILDIFQRGHCFQRDEPVASQSIVSEPVYTPYQLVLANAVNMVTTQMLCFVFDSAHVIPIGDEDDSFKEKLVTFVDSQLKDFVEDIMQEFLDTKLIFGTEPVIFDRTPEEISEDWSRAVQDLAGVFSFDSRLIEQLAASTTRWEDGLEVFADEFETADPEDVLQCLVEGPDEVSVDEVSDILSVSHSETCPVCLEEERRTRKLRICGHLVGHECLVQQLQSRVPSRYFCIICRANLLEIRSLDSL